ncbi:hypothetical protein CEXT_510431 [Caerostris extrusa]|uniref:Uncharacterized protein n=1 Tax=Caerostris extrusa TaxID=172846 RepID=A0AAV4SMW1_CAEEX|nr:hypothetical protein CEXT_510431 [Caerostris extrusa]
MHWRAVFCRRSENRSAPSSRRMESSVIRRPSLSFPSPEASLSLVLLKIGSVGHGNSAFSRRIFKAKNAEDYVAPSIGG